MQRPLLCVLNLKLLAVRSTVWFLLPNTCGKAGLRRESVWYLGLPTSMRKLTIAGLSDIQRRVWDPCYAGRAVCS